MKKIFWLLILSLIFVPLVGLAQVIKLNSGHTIKGKIIKRTKTYIVVDQGLGQPVTYYMDVEKELPAPPPPEPKKFTPPENSDGQKAPEVSLPEITYDTANPNISEYELEKSIEVYGLAYNSQNAKWVEGFISPDAKLFCLDKNYVYNYTGGDYVNMLKTGWKSGSSDKRMIKLDRFVLKADKAATEETVTRKAAKSPDKTYHQINLYAKRNGKVVLIESQALMGEK